MIDAMTTETRSRTTLISVGKQLHASPQTGQDRACLVRLSDGTERLALIQLVTSKQQGSLHRGAEFFRVSFRFVGDDSDPDCQYHLDQNTVWCVIDHKDCQIVFGPTDGIEIRQPGLGIGSYLMAQLIRLIQQSEMRGNYQVQAVHLPIAAQTKVKPEDARANDARIETFLTRVGFYVSPAAGQKVIGVRRAQDLRPWWNQQKVSFLSFPSFVELAARWQREKNQSEKAVEAAQRIVEGAHLHASQLQTAHAEEVASLESKIEQLEGTVSSQEEQHAALIRELLEKQAEETQGLRRQIEDIQSMHGQIEDRVTALNPAQPSAGDTLEARAESATQMQRTLTISLAPALMKLLWAALALSAFALGAGALTNHL
ncbi:hypothetical protein E4L81_33160 [Pseudomonas aeruginosa]|jgi:hypothetical protein|nr:hypothetical protein [Pseudomonas aeruginosa]KWR77933.1 hypothetical protein RN02_17105 [Pseudomonas sp. PI1]OWJ93591.1 hypothetical protein B6S59_15915 [Pseudomonas sp. A46]TRO37959.1 hypothetical protein EQ845_05595 [Pseudomonas putida]KAB0740133.1 hypothetical protein F7O93_26340 [Pseudomonas aeruginosa]KSD69600.1 hypothetical protein AO903_20445 [Pseudomonas aeruginosa]